MIHVKDHKQYDMFSPFERLGPKRLALLESSWAHLFREEILHKLPAQKLFHLYDDFKGRPTKELYAMLGIVLLQQMEDLTDEEAVHQFAFNIMWHYALKSAVRRGSNRNTSKPAGRVARCRKRRCPAWLG